jgi:hypothetical protein
VFDLAVRIGVQVDEVQLRAVRIGGLLEQLAERLLDDGARLQDVEFGKEREEHLCAIVGHVHRQALELRLG